MNKDLDERLVPNGQYRDALNIEVSTSEDSNVGTVQNILGNKRVENIVGENFTCVGSISDEKTNKLYWLISSYTKDMILEYDIANDIASPVLVDTKAGTGKAVLKFFGNIITGINIIDNLLLWSDGVGEPKKINIDICKAGTDQSGNIHTKLKFQNNSFVGIAAEYVWPADMPEDSTGYGAQQEFHPPLLPIEDRIQIGRYIVCERRKFVKMLGFEFDQLIDNYGQIIDANNWTIDSSSSHNAPGNLNSAAGDGYVFKARHYRSGELIGTFRMKMWDNHNGVHMRKDDGIGTDFDFKVGDVIFAVDAWDFVNETHVPTSVDIEEKHITVIKPKPVSQLSVKINYKEKSDTTSKTPNLFEEKIPRFSYRYKYRDGEFSPPAPFTQPVFNPQYTKDTSQSSDASVLYNQDTAYNEKDPRNKAMVNAIHSVDLMDFITIDTPEDVVEVDLLYKQEDSPVIYSINTIKHTDYEWHRSVFNGQIINPIINGTGRYDGNISQTVKEWMPAADGGYNSGKYEVTTENIYAALPANQILRPWDNVPRAARAQEVSGSRVIYGNYLQNYTIGSKPKVFLDYSDRKKTLNSFDLKGLPSIKSQRNYQLGVIYCDEFGRETPVFTSNSGAINIPWAGESGNKNASKSNQLIASATNNFPDWVDSIKFFVKENSGEYYNLVMERAWTGKSTYEIDNSEGHLWISFASSERNKISEEDHIILKKKVGVGEKQISFENKFKVIDIQNEAPDALKYELINLGTVSNDADNTLTVDSASKDRLFSPNYRPDKLVDSIHINIDRWKKNSDTTAYRGDLMPSTSTGDKPVKVDDLYLSWSRLATDGTVTSSAKYKVTSGWRSSDSYIFILNRKIKEIDADIAHINGNSTRDTAETNVHPDLVFQVEKRVLKDQENFSGQFFVKISENQVASAIQSGAEITSNNINKYQVKADNGVWYWLDDTNGTTQDNSQDPHIYQSGQPYGLTNFFGDNTLHSDPLDNIQNSGGGNNNQNANGTVARLTDWHVMWENVLGELNGKPRFFIDAVHMASGQSQESDYAKYNCITWSGASPNNVIPGTSLTSWSYPPLKKWWTDVTNNELEVDVLDVFSSNSEGESTSYFSTSSSTSEIISISPLFDQNQNWTIPADNDDDVLGLKMDGWVGSSQYVSRVTPTGAIPENHINGLEGLVTTNGYHTNGPRRWVSGMNGVDSGCGEDTETYGSLGEEERHFMHLSFFAPGRDLHNNEWHFDTPTLYGEDTFMDNLQGIWGGGVFTGKQFQERFGSDSDDENKHPHLAMEGNYADGDNNPHLIYSAAPGPGNGFGYDLDYRELHERQWDPTFNSGGDPDNKIRDFIRNIYPGSKFRFNFKIPGANGSAASSATIDDAVYTIKKVNIKKLYNHTSWRANHNMWIDAAGGYKWDNIYNSPGNIAAEYRSVENMALLWLDTVDKDGVSSIANSNAGATSYGVNKLENLKKKIVDFGSAHNRRLCYVIELDKNPAKSQSLMGNPLNQNAAGIHAMSADLDNDNYTHVEFLDPVQDLVLSDLNKFPAIWELSPKKQDVDLDIYYEASGNIPVRINRHTNEIFAPKGCLVEIINSPTNQDVAKVHLVEWNDNVAVFEPGFVRGFDGSEVNYSNLKFKFIRSDGSYTVAETGLQQLISDASGYKTKFTFKPGIGSLIQSGLSWYNCFSFGNGLESNRVQDGFNEMQITNGVKVSTTVQQTYEEERRAHGLIYSGLYNSNSGVNDLNQFIMAEKITKDLNPIYGSIQKLFSRNTDLIAFCEDKVIKVLANKDAVFNADGNAQLTANQGVLGQTIPFVGEYGIAKNPESFASESYRAYFTDKQRGAVLRLSKDGLTPISKAGMHDWFRDNLSKHTSLIGTYDSYKENYNITLSNTYTENIIFNTYFRLGSESQSIDASVLSAVSNGSPITGSSYEHTFETKNIYTNNAYDWDVDEHFVTEVTVRNHPFIPKGHFQQEYIYGGGTIPAEIIAEAYDVTTTTQAFEAEIPFEEADYHYVNNLGDSGGGAGWFYDADYGSVSNNIFGPGAHTYGDTDPYIFSRIYRTCSDQEVDENDPSAHPDVGSYQSGTISGLINVPTTGDSSVDISVVWPRVRHNNGVCHQGSPSGTITRNSNSGFIVFDGVYEHDYSNNYQGPNGLHDDSYNQQMNMDHWYVNIRAVGIGAGFSYQSGTLNDVYHSYPGISYEGHNAVYNGEEIHVVVTIRIFETDYSLSSPEQYAGYGVSSNLADGCRGYNYIEPYFQLCDGTTPIPQNKFVQNLGGQDDGGSLNNPYNDNGSAEGWASWLQQTISTWPSDATQPDNNGNFGAVTHQYVSTSSGDADYWSFAGWQDSNKAQFTNTHNIAEMTSTDYNDAPIMRTVKLGASFKFRDPNQQNANGTYSGSGYGIEDALVVSDLTIRIGNSKKPKHNHNYATSNNYWWMNRQLWEITNVEVKKGLGITAPHTDFVAEVPELTETNEYFDLLSTASVQEQLTAAQIIANYPGAALNADGDYVLNQDAIDAWLLSQANETWLFDVPPIPPHDVDAFVEVVHSTNANNNWIKGIYNGTGVTAQQWYTGNTTSFFGNNRSANSQSQQKYLPGDSNGNPTGTTVYWWEKGPNPAGQQPQEGNYGNSAGIFDKDITDKMLTIESPPPAGDKGAFENNVGSTPGEKIYPNFHNEYWQIYQTGSANGYSIHTSHPLEITQANEWYMVDIELWTGGPSNPSPLTHTSGVNDWSSPGDPNQVPTHFNLFSSGQGFISVRDVVDSGLANLYNLAEMGGVGVVLQGGNGGKHVIPVPTYRTEYGDPKWVLRAVFKVTSNSFVITSGGDDKLILKIHGNTSNRYISNIIARKITYTNNTGTATDWLRDSHVISGTNKHPQYHALTKLKCYFHNNAFNWENVYTSDNYLAGTSGNDESWWSQDLSSNPILNVGSGWILNFTVGPNTRTGDFSGILGFRVTNGIGDHPTDSSLFTGILGEGIVDQGNYEVKFTMDTDTSSNNVSGEAWSIKKGGIGYSAATINEYGTQWSASFAESANTIGFYTGGGATTPLNMSISDVFLTQTETIFSGGQAGSWSFDGFDSTSYQFITWDIYWPDGEVGTNADGRIQFTDCPLIDTSFGTGNTIITANQYIDKVINRYEKYEISFNFRMQDFDADGITIIGSGLFHMYYFNSAGHGFRINDIGDGTDHGSGVEGAIPSSPNYKKEAIFAENGDFLWWRVTKIVGIGDGSVYNPITGNGNILVGNSQTDEDAYSEFLGQGVEAFRDTLVIRKDGSAGVATGWIDDISMKRVHEIELDSGPDGVLGTADDTVVYPQTTLTFSEDVNGWTSFKSFIPESGLSLSKKYFTIKDGFLYRHYIPMKNDGTGWYDCHIKEAENYNHFYDHLPSSTSGYSKITAVMNVEPGVVKTFNTLNYEGTQAYVVNPGDPSKVTPQNALAWALTDFNVSPINYKNLEGWKCTDITTDLDSGSLLTFIKKEGKWFGYIKGKEKENLDTSRFSVQGIGTPYEIEEYTTSGVTTTYTTP